MPQFVPKSVAVEAVQFSDPENPPACVRTHYAMGKYRTFEIDSADGVTVWVCPGDWVVTAAANELRRYTAEQFAASFQPVPDEAARTAHLFDKWGGALKLLADS